jgi:hypothetical protein
MTVAEVFEQAKTLSAQERKELIKLLVDTLDVSEPEPKTGPEIAAMLETRQSPKVEE